MLVNSPMADTGGGDATSGVVTGRPAAVIATTPKRVVVGKTEMSAVTCKNMYTRGKGDTSVTTDAHITATKMQHIHEGGHVTAIVPSGDECTSSGSRCICDTDLNVPLHKRLNANLTMRAKDGKTQILDSGFLVEPNFSLSWTESTSDIDLTSENTISRKESSDSVVGRNMSSVCTFDSNVSSEFTVDSTLASANIGDNTVSSESTIDSRMSPDSTSDSRMSTECTADSKVSSDLTVNCKMSSHSTADNTLSADSAVDNRVSSDVTVDTKTLSPDSIIDNNNKLSPGSAVDISVSTDSKVLSNSTADSKSNNTVNKKVSPDSTVDTKMSSNNTIDSRVSPDNTVDSKVSPDNTVDSKVSSDNTVVSKVSSCDAAVNMDSSLHLMSATDETCRKQSPVYDEIQPMEEERGKASEGHGFAEETGRNEVEATATGIEEYLTNWDPETPIKSTRRNRRKRRDTGNFLKIHMKMQTLEDTPNRSVGSPSDAHLGIRRSRRIRRKSMQLQQVVPPTGVEMEEEGNSEIPAVKLDATFVVTPPAPLVGSSPSVDIGSDCVGTERTFVTLHCFRQREHIPSRDVMATDQSAMTTKCPHEPTEWVNIVPPEDSSDTSDHRFNHRRKCTQGVDIVETDASPQTPQKRPKKQGRRKKPQPVDAEELHVHRSQMPVTDQIGTTIPEDDVILVGTESSRVVEASHVAIKKRGPPRKIRQQARRQRLTKLGKNEEMTALLNSKLHACGDVPQVHSGSLSNTIQETTEETRQHNLASDSQESLADWDPETLLKLVQKKHRRRRDTGDFLKTNLQTLDDFDTSDKSRSPSPCDVQLNLRQSRRIRRRSAQLQKMPPDSLDREQVGPSGNSEMNFDIPTVLSSPNGTTCVDVNREQDVEPGSYKADRKCDTLCTSPRHKSVPLDVTTSDSVTTQQGDIVNACPSDTETTQCPGIVPPEEWSVSGDAPSDRRSNRRRRCAQRVSIVEIDLSPETPKKKRRLKRGKKPEPVNLDDLYNNRLWRSQMPAEDQRWPTIPEEEDSFHGESQSTGSVAATRVISKQRAIKFSDFYTKARLTRRRQKARRQGWKPPRRKQVEKEAMEALLADRLRALDDDIRLIGD